MNNAAYGRKRNLHQPVILSHSFFRVPPFSALTRKMKLGDVLMPEIVMDKR